MTSTEHSSASKYSPSLSHPAVVTRAVNNMLPSLRSLSPELRQTLRTTLPRSIPWLDSATAFTPELLEELQRQHVRFRHYERQVQGVLSSIPAIEDFAEPLLREAIEHSFQLQVDVRKTFLFNAGRMQIDDSFVNPDDLISAVVKASKQCTRTLLTAALQNFEAGETEAGGMDGHGSRAQIFTTPGGTAMELETIAVDIAPERFAAMCRTLDLGGRYKQLVSAAFAPPASADESALAARLNRRGLFKLFEQASLRLQLHLAYLQSRIGETMYRSVLGLSRNMPMGRDAMQRCSFLRLWDVELCGILLFRIAAAEPGTVDRVMLYVPEDPQMPMKAFESASACYRDLRDRLLQPAYRNFFLRFIPARHRAGVMQRLKRAINPSVWNAAGFYEEGFDKDAALHFTEEPAHGALLNLMLEQKIRVQMDDGLFHGVPTAQKDEEAADERARYLENVAFNVLNVASFVVPGLGEVMLAVTAAQLGHEVYEGFASLARGEREEAWAYLMDVAESVVTGVALVAATGGTLSIPANVQAMRSVELPFGGERLWKPDIAPYAQPVELPENLGADADGLYAHQGRQWLKLEGHTFAVQPRGDGGYVLEHPSRSTAYQPALRHNGEGGWLHELDEPATWPRQTLLQRLGPRYAGLPDTLVQQAMAVSGINETHLRQTLMTAVRPPAVFADTVARLRLARQLTQEGILDASSFEAGYRHLQPALSEGGDVLRRAFPGVPDAIVEELLRQATAAELIQLRSSARVPQRLAEEARAFQQEVRLARAYEGLFFDPAFNPDSALLVLHGLERLPGWPGDLRVEIRSDTVTGPLLHAIGPAEAPTRLTVVSRGANGYTSQGGDGGLYDALYAQLPADCRSALGVNSARDLGDRLGRLPLLPRAHARNLLKMQPLRPGFRSPMRLANGRVGFPMSGGVAGLILRDTLLDKIRLLQLGTLDAEEVLERLSSAGLDRMTINARLDELLEQQHSLRNSLDHWTIASSADRVGLARQHSRTAINDALWAHWEANLLPELGRSPTPLTLQTIYFADFPADLPQFYRDSVTALVMRYVRPAPLFEESLAFVDLGASWPASLGQFRQLGSLEVQGAGWRTSLLQELVAYYPRLEDLRLIENGLRLDGAGFDALARLPRLRRLDVSGNRLSNVFNIERFTLTLSYLGMEAMRLERWPRWLNAEALSRIEALSLANNRMDELPAMVIDGSFQQQWGRRLTLRGNPLSWQVLLDLRLAEGATADISYRLRSPLNTRDLAMRLRERSDLAEMLDLWVEGRGADDRPAPREIENRRRLSRVMLDFWREDLRQEGSVVLRLEGLSVASFPTNLPTFFYLRARWMELRNFQATTAELDRFLRMFPRLVDLGLTDSRTALTELPQVLGSQHELSELALVRLGMTIGQTEMELLAQMPALNTLQLDGNRLGNIVSPPLGDSLTYLSLAEMYITTWPNWLTDLAAQGIEMLNLDGNLLTELPEELLANRRRDVGAVEITLRNNPLTLETLTRAHTSQDFNRPYCFTLDLPPEIEAMPRTPHSSDSEGSVFGDETHEEGWTPQSTAWDVDDAAQGERFTAAWNALRDETDAPRLLRLIDRLRLSADYRTASTRPEMVARVLRVLEAAGQDPVLRQLLDGMAEEPLQQFQQYQTCPDGIRVEFNQMEIHVYTQEALRGIDPEQRAAGLFRLMRRLFRSQRLDAIARDSAGTRDQAEVRLAYRLRWGNELDLPEPPRHMLYRSSADIRSGELDAARASLSQAERGRPLLDYAADCEFWVSYLRETYAIRFTALKDAFEARVLELIDLYPEDSAERSSERVRQVEATFKEDERALIDELTIAERSLHDH